MTIDPELLDKLLKRLRSQHAGTLDGKAEEALLDTAFDEFNFDGDEMDLLDALRAAARPASKSGPRAQKPPSGGPARPQQERRPLDLNLVTAPYRFVALPNAVVPAEKAAIDARLDRSLEHGFSGRITVHWAFETPVLIGQGDDISLPTTLDGDPVIPGATLRGLLRATVEIVSHGRLQQANLHHRYGVRDFEHPLFTDENRPLWESIGSAWLRKAGDGDPEKQADDSEYVLELCAKRTIRIRDLPMDLNGGRPTDNGKWHKDWLGKALTERYEAAGMKAKGNDKDKDKDKDKIVDFGKSATYSDVGGGHDVRPGSGGFRGVLVFSGKSPTLRDISPSDLDEQDRNPRPGNQKKREYVFSARPTSTPVRLKKEVWDRFNLMNSRPAKNKREPTGSWGDLAPTLFDGGRIPVFFIGALDRQLDPGFDIGLTRLFKRAHRKSVEDVLESAGHGPPASSDLDIATALFGHVFEDDEWRDLSGSPRDDPARKGRIAVGFATLAPDTPAKLGAPIETVMMAPRASFAPHYLRGPVKDWSEPAGPAGRKRYLPETGADWRTRQSRIYDRLRSWKGNDNADLRSKLRYLEPADDRTGLTFIGEIRLHNVTAVELGAVLWALMHGGDPAKPYRHMIGRGKAAGAGRARVARVDLTLAALQEAGAANLSAPEPWELADGKREGWTVGKGTSLAPFLRVFERHMQAHVAEWPDTQSVREFLGISSPAICADLPREYLHLNAHRKIQGAVKATAKTRPASNTPDRLLPAPKIDSVKRPYLPVVD